MSFVEKLDIIGGVSEQKKNEIMEIFHQEVDLLCSQLNSLYSEKVELLNKLTNENNALKLQLRDKKSSEQITNTKAKK